MDFIDPSQLEPCPKCSNDLVYIKAGISKYDGRPYEAYYKCVNDCRVQHANSTYPVKFMASKVQKYLKKV